MVKIMIRKIIEFFEEHSSRRYILSTVLLIIHVIIPFCYITWLLLVFKSSPEFSILKFEELGKLYYTRSVTCSFLFFTAPVFLVIFCYLFEIAFNKVKTFFK